MVFGVGRTGSDTLRSGWPPNFFLLRIPKEHFFGGEGGRGGFFSSVCLNLFSPVVYYYYYYFSLSPNPGTLTSGGGFHGEGFFFFFCFCFFFLPSFLPSFPSSSAVVNKHGKDLESFEGSPWSAQKHRNQIIKQQKKEKKSNPDLTSSRQGPWFPAPPHTLDIDRRYTASRLGPNTNLALRAWSRERFRDGSLGPSRRTAFLGTRGRGGGGISCHSLFA